MALHTELTLAQATVLGDDLAAELLDQEAITVG